MVGATVRPRFATSPRRRAAAWVLVFYLTAHVVLLAFVVALPFQHPLDPDTGLGRAYLRLLEANLPIAVIEAVLIAPVAAVTSLSVMWKRDLSLPRTLLLALGGAGIALALLFYTEFRLLGWGDPLWELGSSQSLTSESAYRRAVTGFTVGNLLVFLATLLIILGADSGPLKKLSGKWFA